MSLVTQNSLFVVNVLSLGSAFSDSFYSLAFTLCVGMEGEFFYPIPISTLRKPSVGEWL